MVDGIPYTQDVSWTYVRLSEDVQHIFGSSYAHSTYRLVYRAKLFSICLPFGFILSFYVCFVFSTPWFFFYQQLRINCNTVSDHWIWIRRTGKCWCTISEEKEFFWYLFLELVPSSALWNFLDNFFEAVLFVHNLKKKTCKQTKMQKKATIKRVSKRN